MSDIEDRLARLEARQDTSAAQHETTAQQREPIAASRERSEPAPDAPRDLAAVLAGMEREDGVYLVTDDHELQAMDADLGANYRLANDIDASLTGGWNDGAGFEPVGGFGDPFTGTFDGDGHTIHGLTSSRGEDVGLFGWNDGLVESVGIEAGDITGDDFVGGVVGVNDRDGELRQVYATGTVSATSDAVGGLVGVNAEGTVRASCAAVDVSGDTEVGGLVGVNLTGTVSNVSAAGTVSGTTGVGGLVGLNFGGAVRDAHAAGTVSGDFDVGGLVGLSEFGAVHDSHATGSVSGGDRLEHPSPIS